MNKSKADKFQGIWPAMFTPVDDTGELNVKSLEKLIELLIAQNMDGIYLLGSTGQGFLFSENQRMKIVEISMEIINNRLPAIVQVGALNTEESVRLAKHAASHGADGISSVGPIYYAASAAMGIEHYRKIASATELPFFPYQIGNSVMNDEVISGLMKFPNIGGLKLTTMNLIEISNIYNKVGDKWKLFSGADELFCHASLCGAAGAIGTSYNLIGSSCKYIREEFLKGDVDLAKDFMLRLQWLIKEIMPSIWTFFNRAMNLKYQIDIGMPKAPLLAPKLSWSDNKIISTVEELEAFEKKANQISS